MIKMMKKYVMPPPLTLFNKGALEKIILKTEKVLCDVFDFNHRLSKNDLSLIGKT